MSTYTHVLTDIEEACGVTLDQVAHYLPRGSFIAQGEKFITDAPGAALSASVARCAFDGAEVEFLGLNKVGHAVYREVAL